MDAFGGYGSGLKPVTSSVSEIPRRVAATCGGWGVCRLSWADEGPVVTVVSAAIRSFVAQCGPSQSCRLPKQRSAVSWTSPGSDSMYRREIQHDYEPA
jgi:hypothetical protein